MKLLLLIPIVGLVSCAVPGKKFDPRAKISVSSVEPAFDKTEAKIAPPASMLQAPSEAYKLGPGDKLDIEILGETGSRAETFVTPDGKLYYNLLDGLDVAGISPEQLKQQLETKLVQFYKHPQVSVTLLDAVSQRVWVLGRVNSPGIYPLKRPLARAGCCISCGWSLYFSLYWDHGGAGGSPTQLRRERRRDAARGFPKADS